MTIPHEFHVHRFVLEAISPVMIASGDDDPLLDNLLVRDANGLPMIPATTLAGAVRAQLPDKARDLFGFQDLHEGRRSTLVFTDALAHWGDDKPRDGWCLLPKSDSIVSLLLKDSPVTRQHVRLDAYGITDGTGKFERSACPTGTRFTFEVSTWGDKAGLDTVVGRICGGLFLGGAKRSGYGELKCLRDGRLSFDLKDSTGIKNYCDYAGRRLDDCSLFNMAPSTSAETTPAPCWQLEGQIEGPLLIGSPRENGRGGRQSYREVQIKWDEQEEREPSVSAAVVVPGSAIKGPLRHRTRYYLGRCGYKDADADARIESLLGSEASVNGGKAGKLRFHDAEVEAKEQITVFHVSLDRFTGGARDKSGALFSDDMLWRPKVKIRIDQLDAISEDEEKAFVSALEDLSTGLLGIGAEWGEGAGVFGSCTRTDPKRGTVIDES